MSQTQVLGSNPREGIVLLSTSPYPKFGRVSQNVLHNGQTGLFNFYRKSEHERNTSTPFNFEISTAPLFQLVINSWNKLITIGPTCFNNSYLFILHTEYDYGSHKVLRMRIKYLAIQGFNFYYFNDEQSAFREVELKF
jgi:hypothetical protein